jgi:hypothetical protein
MGYMTDAYGDAPGPAPALDVSPCQDVSMNYVFGASQAAQNAVRHVINVSVPPRCAMDYCPMSLSYSEVHV